LTIPICDLDDGVVRLRPLRREDWQRTQEWRNDPEIRDAILGHRFPVTSEMEEEWVASVLRNRGNDRAIYAIELCDDDTMVGLVYLNGIDWLHRTADSGIVIGDKIRHRQGLGRRALTLLQAQAFEVLNLRKLTARIAAYNEPSLRLFARCGFEREGVQRAQIYLRGEYHDLVLLGRIAEDAGQCAALPGS
jgi:diamine N-acetyltransferase